MFRYLVIAATLSLACVLAGSAQAAEDESGRWIDEIVSASAAGQLAPALPQLKLIRQDHEHLEFAKSAINTPIKIGAKQFAHGLGTHSVGHIQVISSVPITRFRAWVGIDNNARTAGGMGSVEFVLSSGGKELYRGKIVRSGNEPERVDVELPEIGELDLQVTDGGDNTNYDHADWADAQISLSDGRRLWLDELPVAGATVVGGAFPFSFNYAGKSSEQLLPTWTRHEEPPSADGQARRMEICWDDPATGLRVSWQLTRWTDYPAAEWVLWFENRGKADTEIIDNVQAMNVLFRSPLSSGPRYRLYRTKGGPYRPDGFEPAAVAVDREHPQIASAGDGRSSCRDFPFFKLDTARGSVVVAVGWSGMWRADFACSDNRQLQVTAGLDKTHFRLHPGERVRSPRMLLLTNCGDTWEANAKFRDLIYKHYAAKRMDKVPLPMLFCNTCYTRGGGWLNECNAANQISLINAYAPLGLEALITDAGWFEGGWPAGAGNWNPRKDAYPEGMGPVAAAAKAKGLIYGLWFEPERVVANTWLHKNRPEWILRSKEGKQDTFLLNFGLPEVQKYFFEIVKGFMDLPGFRFYRQDFNMDPLPYWRFNDAADRQGITEMKYVEGLYAYWDSIARSWPDSIREECAGGGHRIDLETVKRMHVHQKSDISFNNEFDQASLWGLSQYLPNNIVVTPINRMDDYSFHSTLASSLCLGWISDAKDFDLDRAKELTDRYLEVRHLLTGAWYPLLPYSMDEKEWTGSQYHRADLDRGILLIFRRAESPYRTVEVVLRGVKPRQAYELECFAVDGTRQGMTVPGSQLLSGIKLTLPNRHQSDLIVYRATNK